MQLTKDNSSNESTDCASDNSDVEIYPINYSDLSNDSINNFLSEDD